jgi:hypothetical protein
MDTETFVERGSDSLQVFLELNHFNIENVLHSVYQDLIYRLLE